MDMLMIMAIAVLGLVLGSFAGAQVWRLRAYELATGTELTIQEKRERTKLARLRGHSVQNDRSICLHCGHTLAWYDLIPLLSWVSTAGKCRYCHRGIGWMEPIIELTTSGFLVASYLVLFSHEPCSALLVGRMISWTAAVVCLAILFWYDLRWSILPLGVNLGLIGSSFLYAILTIIAQGGGADGAAHALVGVMLLGGTYWLLHVVSSGRWVGGGDYKLAAGLALLLVDWRLAISTLFAANLIGCMIVAPALLSGRTSAKSHVPFGPLLILGFGVVFFSSTYIVSFFTDYILP